MTLSRRRLALLFVVCATLLPAQYRQRQRGDKPNSSRGAPSQEVLLQFEGTVKLITKKQISLETEGEQTMEFRVTRKTVCYKDEKKAALEGIPVGARLKIEGKRQLNGDLDAVNVWWDVPKESPAQTP